MQESEVAQSCPTLSDPMDCSLPGSPSMGFSRQEYWSGVPLPSPLSGYWGLTLQPESPNFPAVLQESLKLLGLGKYSLNILGISMFSRITNSQNPFPQEFLNNVLHLPLPPPQNFYIPEEF